MLKNKNNLIAIGVVVFVIVGLLGYYFLSNNTKVEPEQKQSSEAVVETIKPEDIGFSIEATPDKKKVKFSITKAQGIKAIEYQITYEADSTAQEKSEGGEPRVQRGITGEVAVPAGKSSFESEDLDLGSCSRNVCRYDTGVNEIEITLKISKSDNKIYDLQDTLSLE